MSGSTLRAYLGRKRRGLQVFDEIAEEMERAGSRQDRSDIFSRAPAYIFSCGNEPDAYVDSSLSALWEILEEKGLLQGQADECLHLFLEYGIPEYGSRETYGFSDMSGHFRRTLEQWVSHVNRQHQVSQGIILIRIRWTEELLSEMAWWNRFFRHLHWFRKDFLFLFLIEGDEADRGLRLLQKGCFCKGMEIRKRHADEYQEQFLFVLEEAGLSLSGEGKEKLARIIKCHEDEVTGQALYRWAEEMVWEHLVSDGQEESLEHTIPVSYIREERLAWHIRNEREPSRIGFG